MADRNTIEVPREIARELAYSQPYETVGDYIVTENQFVDTTRWGTLSDLVVSYDYAYWRATYEQGATEYQDFGPFEDEGETVTFHRVVAIPQVTVQWVTPEQKAKLRLEEE
jgi:hypothetical protein